MSRLDALPTDVANRIWQLVHRDAMASCLDDIRGQHKRFVSAARALDANFWYALLDGNPVWRDRSATAWQADIVVMKTSLHVRVAIELLSFVDDEPSSDTDDDGPGYGSIMIGDPQYWGGAYEMEDAGCNGAVLFCCEGTIPGLVKAAVKAVGSLLTDEDAFMADRRAEIDMYLRIHGHPFQSDL